jgi:hypothetical protein
MQKYFRCELFQYPKEYELHLRRAGVLLGQQIEN